MLRLFEAKREEEADELALRSLRLLAQALELNLLLGRGLQADTLKADLVRLLLSLEQRQEAPVVLENAGAVCGDVKHYFRHLGASIESLASELSVGIRVLEQALADFSGEHERGLERWEQLGQHLAAQRGLDDVHALRLHLESCIEKLQKELKEQRLGQAKRAEAVGVAMGALQQSSTRLSVARPQLVFAVLRLKSLDRVEARFGRTVADAMVALLRETLRAKWPAAEEQPTADPHTLLLVDKEDLDLEKNRQLLRRVASERLTYSATIDDNEHLLPLHLDWFAAHAASAEQMEKMVQSFLAGKT